MLTLAKIKAFEDLQISERSLQINSKSTSWRVNRTYFCSEEGWLKEGNVCLSPAWFQQAHEVACLIHFYLTQFNFSQNATQIEVSTQLMKNNTLEWLKLQIRTSAIIGGILSIVHPEQYAAGIDILRQMNCEPGLVKTSGN